MNLIYKILVILSISSLFILITSIDYKTRLALLIFVFILTGLIYKILDFKFLGLTYIIVYVGAISILFLFVIMKTEAGRSPNLIINPQIKGFHKITFKRKTGIRYDLILSISLFFLILSFYNLLSSSHSSSLFIFNFFNTNYVSSFISFSDIESFGYILYLGYPLIIILLGVLLWCI
jgi:NADH-ubiquinone oxidoreductase chain 6